MKQIIQDLKSGETILEEVPAPAVKPGYVLIRTSHSLVSAGTERMLVSFGKAGWIGKARQQPERVKQVFDKIRTDGFLPTMNAVRNKLDRPIPLGYSNAGTVVAVGEGVEHVRPGDRVVSNGPHAEFVSVPKNLVARIPENVDHADAAFTVVGAIALQGIRLLQPTFGEYVVVTGLGLIGQLAVQLLKANGCHVIGIDIDEKRMELARPYCERVLHATDDVVSAVMDCTSGNGADAVMIAVSSDDDTIIANAAKMSRKRGRIVLTGVTGLDLQRSDFYEKELSFQVSCSYGPGRYDKDYEQNGRDYPVGYVRWTAQRNFEAVLKAMSAGQLQVKHLHDGAINIDAYKQVYDGLSGNAPMANLFVFNGNTDYAQTIQLSTASNNSGGGIALIGAGNFTQSVVLPNLKKLNADIAAIVSENGLSAGLAAQKYKIPTAGSDAGTILRDKHIGTVFILTRHNQHGIQVLEALQNGKNVFVEKPLCINVSELDEIVAAKTKNGGLLHVGFNRRFAPLAIKMRSLAASAAEQFNIVVTVNAGAVPSGHWIQDEAIGGGRIIGEACHFIDLVSFLANSEIHSVCANKMEGAPNEDNVSILLQMKNGSNATINYFANGSNAYDKERIELFGGGKTLILENWRKLSGYGFNGFSTQTATQDKGHAEQFKQLLQAIKTGTALIPFSSVINTTATSFAIVESLRTKAWTTVR